MIRIFRRYVQTWLLALAFCEAGILLAAYYTGVFARFGDIGQFEHELRLHATSAVSFVVILMLAMYSFGAYHSDALVSARVMLTRLGVSFLAGLAAAATVQYMLPVITFWRSALMIAMATGFIGIVGVRFLCLPILRKPAFRRRMVVLGTGERAARIAELEASQAAKTFTCVGFVWIGDNEIKVAPERVARGADAMARLVKEHQASEIVVALQDRRNELPVQALVEQKLSGVEVLEFSTFWERQTGRIDLDTVYPSWLIFSDGFGGGRWRALTKRLFDVVASGAVFIFVLPLYLLSALAVRLGSSGPVYYRQERVGLHGRPFRLLKFRSMRADAEKDGVPRWAATNDQRVTRIGRFMRMTRLDELPQVFNVLKGDMSFIGPRPERPYFVDQLAERIPYYRERHRVKPGISGWAQINYPYGASVEDAKHKLEYDLYYAKNYTLAFDLMIFLQTIRVVLWPSEVR
jgi:sugar transferase (PEP-CTERM system associated)